MRKKISKKVRKKIVQSGGIIKQEIRNPGEKRKDREFGVDVIYKNHHVCAVGTDELEAYRLALDCMKYIDRNPE